MLFTFIKKLFKMTPDSTPVIQTAENNEVPYVTKQIIEVDPEGNENVVSEEDLTHAPESEVGEYVAPVEEVEKKINLPAQAISDVINELSKSTPMQVNGTFNAMMNTLKEAKRLAESL